MSEHERELTPMLRGAAKDISREQACKLQQMQKQQGASQIIKYIDLSKFKIEKCKNLANGRQHNIKHCRYYHTLKDRRRILDYQFMSRGIEEIVQKA